MAISKTAIVCAAAVNGANALALKMAQDLFAEALKKRMDASREGKAQMLDLVRGLKDVPDSDWEAVLEEIEAAVDKGAASTLDAVAGIVNSRVVMLSLAEKGKGK